jgi:hypothetical protein
VIVAAFVLLVAFGAGLGGLNLAGKGVVVGGLEPCDPWGHSSLRYASGKVTVLPGQVTWRPDALGSIAVFPTKVADHQVVGAGGVYVFLLDRGQYVMEGEHARDSARPWVNITVNTGSVAHIDVPGGCI